MDGVIEDRACAQCGARNRSAMGYCWQCYAPFTGGPAPSTGDRLSLGASPPAHLPSDSPVSAIARATAPFAKLDVPPPPPPRARWRAVVPWVLMAAVVVAGWALWQRATGFQLPPTLAGANRIEGGLAEEIDRQLEPARDAYQGEIAVGIYGTGAAPTFAVFLIEKVEGAGGPASLSGLQGATGPIPLDGLDLIPQSGSDVSCGSAEAQGGFGVVCLWEDAEAIGLLTAMGVDLDQARTAAQEVRDTV